MAHAQQQILDAIAATLAAQVTAVAGRVFVDRVDPLQPDELPAILVEESAPEQVQVLTVGGAQQRQLGVRVACVVAGAAAQAQARELGLAAEKALQTSASLVALCRLGIELTSSAPLVEGEADRLMAVRDQGWQMAYAVASHAPDVIL